MKNKTVTDINETFARDLWILVIKNLVDLEMLTIQIK